MSARVLTEAEGARIEGFAEQLVEAGADAPFTYDGLLYFFVPLWVVRAYAQARYVRSDVPLALAGAVFGEADATRLRDQPAMMMWTLARAWAGRLGELERRVRNRPAAAA